MSQAAADGRPGSGKDHGLSFFGHQTVLSGFCLRAGVEGELRIENRQG